MNLGEFKQKMVNYNNWKIVWLNQEVNQKKWVDMNLAQEVNQIDQQLIKEALNYITLAESGKIKADSDFIRKHILENPLFDKELKERATHLLRKA